MKNVSLLSKSPSRGNQLKPISLKLPSSLDVGTLEDKLLDLFQSHGSQIDYLILDLDECIYIEVASLMRIISLVSDIQRKGLRIQIALPKSKDVRDFMRIWNFPNAISNASQISFRDLVVVDDHEYFNENKRPEDIKYHGRIVSPGEQRLLSDRFFQFSTKEINKDDSITSIVVGESKRWEDRLVLSVLENNLSGPAIYISSRTIYEIMSNACRHPNCSLIQVVSRFEASLSNAKPDHFTILAWDNGESMVDTLKRAIHTPGAHIRVKEPTDVHRFKIKYVSTGGVTTTSVYDTRFLPITDTDDFLIFFSTLLPGLTRDPSGIDHTTHPELPLELAFPGMGLFILINAAIDVFGGSVAFRTGRFFMNIKAPTNTEKNRESINYRVKIQEYDQKLPSFLGNMVTVRLPLSRHNQNQDS